MVKFIIEKPQHQEGGPKPFQKEVALLRRPEALRSQIALIDKKRVAGPLRRLLVMGSGRSGTWLLAAMMTSFEGVDLLPAEVPLEYFGLVTTDQPILLLKRDHEVHERVENIPEYIQIVYIVRHPFDVLTSHNPAKSQNLYHIGPARWLGEMLALQYLVDTARPRTTILRYEDLVDDPQNMQNRLSKELELSIATPAERVMENFSVGEGTIKAMHGLRPIDRKSVGRFKSDPASLSYLRQIRPRLGRLLDWVAETYSYDISLDT